MKQNRWVRVDNLTRGTNLTTRGRIADRFWSRCKGLMGVRQLAPGDGLLITPVNQIHTHFMALAIDVLYLNDQGEVIAIDPALPPWRIGQRHPAANAVLELPAGVVARTGSAVGDRLQVRIEAPAR
jgi:uncharacterized membrane protein (UPF0127 family)